MAEIADIVPVLLAGGLGTRLWPLSREIYPKQLLALGGDESLLQQAARRALLVAAPERVITVAAEAHHLPVRDQLGDIDPALTANIVLEPAGRDTAAATAVAALHALTLAEHPMLFVAPADHLVRSPRAVASAVRRAADIGGRLVAFGIAPERPETSCGYIARGAPLGNAAFAAARFIEKPDAARAKELIDTGTVLWNSGMFVFSAALVLEELAAHVPELHAAAHAAFAASSCEGGAVRFPAALYDAIPAAAIDAAVIERSQRVAVIPIDPGWSDVGSWRELWRASARDSCGNAALGDAVVEASRNCMVRSESRLAACAGLEGVVVSETADAVLVASLDDDGAIRALVERLRGDGREEAARHPYERRPWGSFRVLLDGAGFKIKEIVVDPGARLSLQAHSSRSEHWVVLAGTARVVCDDVVRDVAANESAYIPRRARHRLENLGAEPLRIVEVQCGDYLGEDDIVRYDDAYGRAHEEKR